MTQLSVIVPTYREAENLKVLIPRLQQVLSKAKIAAEIIVVDDDSQDGTENVIQQLSEGCPVRLIVRQNERGLSSAVIEGMSAARGDVVLCMDADLSHPPEDVPRLFRVVAERFSGQRAAFALGSRYVLGGSTEVGWGLGRWLNSRIATWLAWPLASVRDPMAGFFALKRREFQRVVEQLDPIGYKIGLELLVKTQAMFVAEVPIEFKNRLHGQSKLSLREQLNYLRHLARLYRFRFPGLTRFLTFGIVGSTGAVVDLLVFTLSLNFGLSPLPAAVIAIWIAMTSNFEWNRRVTFTQDDRHWWLAYLSFCLSCLFGAGVNASVRVGLMSSVNWFNDNAWVAGALGILSGLVFNFLLCERFVFQRPRRTRLEQPWPQPDSSSVEDRQSEIPLRCDEVRSDGRRRVSWISRLLVVIIVALSVLWAKSLLSQNRKPAAEQIEPSRGEDNTGSVAAPQDLPADHQTVQKSASRSSHRALPRHRDFDFSDIDIEQRLKANVRYLASDELEGRGLDTVGLGMAAEFIAREYERAGLNVNPTGHGAFFEFPLLARELQPTVSQVTLVDSNKVLHPLARKRDYSNLVVPMPNQLTGHLVFAGFGIAAPELGYDDFAELDITDCVVIILRQEPSHDRWRKVADENGFSSHALLRTKIQKAMSRGAAAVIFCDAKSQSRLDSDNDPEALLSVDMTSEFPDTTLPVIHVRRAILSTLLAETVQFDLDAAEATIHETLTPQSRHFHDLSMAIRIERPRASRTLKNVIATLSKEPAEPTETIVIGGHYDHLGRGGWGSLELTSRREIHNGADDNASGTALLLEVARQLAARNAQNRDKPLPRRICFIAFSAEELGLIGSSRYVHAPWFPLESTVAMLNLDMVGRLRDDQLTVYGTGTSSVWPSLLRKLAENHQLKVLSREGGYGPSDHASFYEHGVPVLHFFTGFHANYHRPSDDPDTLNYVGLRKLSRAITDLVVDLAGQPVRRQPSTPEMGLAHLDSSLELNDVLGEARGTSRFRLGVQLEASPTGGVRIMRTLPDSLAERHGLRSGDVIQTIDGQPVASPTEAINFIQKHRPQDPLIINLTRNRLRLKIRVTLADFGLDRHP